MLVFLGYRFGLESDSTAICPSKYQVLVDDFENEGIYEDQIDSIQGRYLAGSVGGFHRLMAQAYKYKKPGGWVEFQDWDANVYSEDGSTKDNISREILSIICSGFIKAGFIISPGRRLAEWLRAARFEDVHVKKYRTPLEAGLWPKEKYYKTIGVWNLLQAETGFEASAMALLTRCEGWAKEEVSVLVAGARKGVRDPKIHTLADLQTIQWTKQ